MSIKLFIGAITTLGIAGGGAYSAYVFSVPKTIEEQLKKDWLTLINTNEENDSDETIMKQLIAAYKKDGEGKDKIPNLKDASDSDKQDIKALKNGCRDLFKKENTKENLEIAKDWCVKESKKIIITQTSS